MGRNFLCLSQDEIDDYHAMNLHGREMELLGYDTNVENFKEAVDSGKIKDPAFAQDLVQRIQNEIEQRNKSETIYERLLQRLPEAGGRRAAALGRLRERVEALKKKELAEAHVVIAQAEEVAKTSVEVQTLKSFSSSGVASSETATATPTSSGVATPAPSPAEVATPTIPSSSGPVAAAPVVEAAPAPPATPAGKKK